MGRSKQDIGQWGIQAINEGMVMPKSMLVVGDGHFLPGRHHFVTR